MQDEDRYSDWDFENLDDEQKNDPLDSPEAKAFLERQERTLEEFPDCDRYFEEAELRNISLPVRIKKSSGISRKEFQKKTQNFFTSKDPAKNLEDLKEMDRLFDQAVAYSKKLREERGHTRKRRSRCPSPEPPSDQEQEPASIPETPPEVPDYDPNYVDIWEPNIKRPRIEVVLNQNKQEERPERPRIEVLLNQNKQEERPKSPSKKIGVIKIPQYPIVKIKENKHYALAGRTRKRVCKEINEKMQEFVDSIPEKTAAEGMPLTEIKERMITYFNMPSLTGNGIAKLSSFPDHFCKKKKRQGDNFIILYYKKT